LAYNVDPSTAFCRTDAAMVGLFGYDFLQNTLASTL
jgi:hypothetical protein